jgi:hypothetical protein
MRPIQNNLANLQINQIAMEQAALQAAKSKQADQVRAQIAEEVLQQKDATKKALTDPKNQKNSNQKNFKNLLYSKNGTPQPQSSPDTLPSENIPPIQITHIDFKI